jgi:hypothetical protein
MNLYRKDAISLLRLFCIKNKESNTSKIENKLHQKPGMNIDSSKCYKIYITKVRQKKSNTHLEVRQKKCIMINEIMSCRREGNELRIKTF